MTKEYCSVKFTLVVSPVLRNGEHFELVLLSLTEIFKYFLTCLLNTQGLKSAQY